MNIFSFRHLFHVVDRSPWPLFASISVFFLAMGGVIYMHFYKFGLFLIILGFFLVVCCSFGWWQDIIREGTFLGFHTKLVQKQIKLSIFFFIITEALLFLSFFWAFFHSSLAPALEIGGVWPPEGIQILLTFKVPLLNTLILLMSGVFITISHHYLCKITKILKVNYNLSLNTFGVWINLRISKKLKIFFLKWFHLLSYYNIFLKNNNNYFYIIEFFSDVFSKEFKLNLNSYFIVNKIFKFFVFIVRFFQIKEYENYKGERLSFNFKRNWTNYYSYFLYFFNLNIIFKFILKQIWYENKLYYFNFIFLGIIITLVLAVCFMYFQYLEYKNSCYGISDSVFGSSFFLATGFHGAHVSIGGFFIFICFFRFLNYHFTSNHHVGFEAAIWYWHFVDVVWLFLFLTIYWWGGLS